MKPKNKDIQIWSKKRKQKKIKKKMRYNDYMNEHIDQDKNYFSNSNNLFM